MSTATPLAPTIGPAALAQQSEGAVGILDVRTPAEYETAHIPCSYNLPLELPIAADLRLAAQT